jgi:hypothetical protein
MVTKGRVAPRALRGLKIDLRGVLARNVMVDTQLCEILQQSWMLERLAEATESKRHLTHDGVKVSVNRHFQKVIAEQYYRQFRPLPLPAATTALIK